MEDRRENDRSSWLMLEPKKNCVEPLKDVSQNNEDNKENLHGVYDTDSTIIYTPDNPKLTSRTEEKLSTRANAILSCHSSNTCKK